MKLIILRIYFSRSSAIIGVFNLCEYPISTVLTTLIYLVLMLYITNSIGNLAFLTQWIAV